MRKTIYNYTYRPEWLICFLVPLIWVCCDSCNKYLDAKPDQTIATPSTIEDLEGILDNYNFINARYPSASEVSSDDFYLASSNWSSLIEPQRNYYIWQKYDNAVGDYTAPYTAVEYANIILDALPKIPASDVSRKNAVQGNALFIRASYHYALAQLFAKAYDGKTASTDLGIVIRMTSDIAVKPVRSTIAETYEAVLKDLKRSIPLLPASPTLKYRASKPAAYGMLARVCLSMRDYKSAGLYADSALRFYNKLINYSTIDTAAAIPFQQFNDEVIYDARSIPPQALSQYLALVDTVLYNSYASGDLRKTILFKSNGDGSHAFKGSYTGQITPYLFTGIATNEIYLIKAEAAVRNGDVALALQVLNTLLATRWVQGTYVPYTNTDPDQLLKYILLERRKDLLFRTLRWTDLRRLNKEPSYSKVLYRNVNNETYTLQPNSPRYVFEIDKNAVNISSLTQNP